jgi:glucokinase
MNETLLGIDLGGTKIAVAAVRDGIIIEKKIVSTPKEGWASVCAQMIETGLEVIAAVRETTGGEVSGIGVGTPGPIDFATGVVKFAPNIPGFENAPIVATLSKGFGRKIEIENDANAAGLAEHVYGAAQAASSSIFITVSSGVGGGIIIHDRVWRGAHGVAGEVGHIVSLPGGPIAGSGVSGALEAFSSGTAIAKDCTYAYSRPVTTREAFELAQAGDARAVKIIDQAARYLGSAIADFQKVIDPEVFVLGGGVSEVGDFFLDKVRAVAEDGARGFAIPVIYAAKLGTDAGVIGAALAGRA